MKRRNRVQKRDSKNAAISQAQNPPHKAPEWGSNEWLNSLAPVRLPGVKLAKALAGIGLAASLGFTPDQTKALALVCQWNSQTPKDLIREITLGVIRMHYDDMRGFAEGLLGYQRGPKEHAWAKRFYIHLSPLVEGRENEYGG